LCLWLTCTFLLTYFSHRNNFTRYVIVAINITIIIISVYSRCFKFSIFKNHLKIQQKIWCISVLHFDHCFILRNNLNYILVHYNRKMHISYSSFNLKYHRDYFEIISLKDKEEHVKQCTQICICYCYSYFFIYFYTGTTFITACILKHHYIL
jgi:hypothetical protein